MHNNNLESFLDLDNSRQEPEAISATIYCLQLISILVNIKYRLKRR